MTGYGAVAQALLPMIFEHVRMPYRNMTIIDFENGEAQLAPWLDEFVNTWSVEGMWEEAIAPSELGCGHAREMASTVRHSSEDRSPQSGHTSADGIEYVGSFLRARARDRRHDRPAW